MQQNKPNKVKTVVVKIGADEYKWLRDFRANLSDGRDLEAVTFAEVVKIALELAKQAKSGAIVNQSNDRMDKTSPSELSAVATRLEQMILTLNKAVECVVGAIDRIEKLNEEKHRGGGSANFPARTGKRA